MIEAIILALPIENLNGVRDSLSNVYNKVLSFFKGLPGAVKGRDKKAEMQSQDLSSYKKDFDTKPDTLLEDDDDEEDVGKIAKHSDNLDFNSDEKEEIIAPVQKRSKDVPKLKKPNKWAIVERVISKLLIHKLLIFLVKKMKLSESLLLLLHLQL